jgi:ribonuclease P protein component
LTESHPSSSLGKNVGKPNVFPKTARIVHRNDFRAIFDTKRSIRIRGAVIVWRLSTSDRSRLGLSVGRRVGGAVHRNRIKRIWREVFRCHRDLLPCPIDLVFIPNDPILCADYRMSCEAFAEFVRRLEKAVTRGLTS